MCTIRTPIASLAAVSLAMWALVFPSAANAQDAGTSSTNAGETPAWPRNVPGLGVQIDDPGDDRTWTLTTRIESEALSVMATSSGGSLAVVFRRTLRNRGTCPQLVARAFRTDALDEFRVTEGTILRGAPWDSEVFRQLSRTHHAEFGCLTVGRNRWMVTVLAQPSAGVTLLDAVSMATRLAGALTSPGARHDFPLRLVHSEVDLPGLQTEHPWLLSGRAPLLPFPADGLSSGAGNAGGVTLAIARPNVRCEEAWNQLRPALASEGTQVDRPGYVPVFFGARIRRINTQGRTREIYCVDVQGRALLVSSVFATDDTDAMLRVTPVLRALSLSPSSTQDRAGAATPNPRATTR